MRSRLVVKLGDIVYACLRKIQIPVYEKYLLSKLREGPVPSHIGVILDGNRRFARSLGLDLVDGYRLGAKKVREILSWCDELGIEHITLYAFSTENFSRPPDQVEAVFSVIREELRRLLAELEELKRRGVRVRFIGRLELMPPDIQELAKEIERATEGFGEKTVNIALAYGGRAEIIDAVRKIAELVKEGKLDPEEIDESTFENFLYLKDIPDPDLIIRTSGEERISNFLLWHAAYSELYFLEAYLPTLRRVDFLRAIRDYQRRQRRYGR